MLMAIIAMWMSTVAYWIATLLVAVETQLTLRNIMTHALANVDQARSCVGFSSGGRPFMDCQSESPVKEVPDYLEVYGAQQCIGTVALTINVSMYTDSKDQELTPVCQVIIGDAVVWWRAWVLWTDHRVVLYTWITLVLATTGTLFVYVIAVHSY